MFNIGASLISLDDAATTQGRLVIARLALMGILQWFGYPEVPQITDAGKLRRPYIGRQKQGWSGELGRYERRGDRGHHG